MTREDIRRRVREHVARSKDIVLEPRLHHPRKPCLALISAHSVAPSRSTLHVCDVGRRQQSREIVGIDCNALAMTCCVLHGQSGMPEHRSKLSSGTLLYRFLAGTTEVLLVHPAG